MNRIGLAIGPGRIVAWVGGRAIPLDPELPSALAELRELVPGPATVHLAVLPPLVEIKRMEFPPLGRARLEAVLTRDADRHFLTATGEQVVSTARIGKSTVMAAAMAGELAERIYREVESRRWTVGSVIPAQVAWVVSLGRRPAGCVLVFTDGAVELLVIEAGRLAMTRRLRNGPAPALAARVADACRGLGPLVLLAPGWSPDLRAALAARGVEVAPESEPWAAEPPEVLAARFASASDFLELVPPSAHAAAAARVRRLTRLLYAAAAGLVIATGALEWWGTARELDRVAAARARHHRQVAEALEVRAGLDRWDGRLATLRAAETGGIRWSGLLASLAEHLPEDAHLTALRAEPDSLILEGEAAQAPAAFESLQKMPAVAGIRALAPIRQETRDSGPPIERFVLGAVLRPDGDSGAREP